MGVFLSLGQGGAALPLWGLGQSPSGITAREGGTICQLFALVMNHYGHSYFSDFKQLLGNTVFQVQTAV